MGDTPSRPLSPYMLWHLCYTNFILQLFVVNHHGCRRNPQSCRSKKKHAVLFTGKTPYLFTSAVLVLSLWLSLSLSLSRSLSLYLSQSPSNKDCIFVAKKHCVVDSIPILAEWIQMCAWQIVYCWVVFVGICWWNSCFSCQTSVHPSCFWQITTTVGKHHIFLARHQFILQCFWMFLDVSGKSPYFHICSG